MLRLTALTALSIVAALLLPPAAVAQPPRWPTCFGKPATIVGTQGRDRLAGTNGPDVIVGLGGYDVIRGGRGADLICGNGGADRLVGGPGHDRLHGGTVPRPDLPEDGPGFWEPDSDLFIPGPGNDYIVPGPGLDRVPRGRLSKVLIYRSSRKAVHVDIPARRVRGEGVDRLAGTRLAIAGSPYADTMRGGPGTDFFEGYGGADVLTGRGGKDWLYDNGQEGWYACGKDKAADRLTGGDGDDYLFSCTGRDTLHGGAGRDAVRDYGTSPDRLYGGDGRDWLVDFWTWHRGSVVDGGGGVDELLADIDFWRDGRRIYPPTTIDLRSGVTTIRARATTTVQTTGIENLSWGGGRLTIHGTEADNDIIGYGATSAGLVAYGHGGDDTIFGSTGDDRIDGGAGTDSASADSGRDRCIAIEDADDCELIEEAR